MAKKKATTEMPEGLSKEDAWNLSIKQCQKDFGKEVLILLDQKAIEDFPHISTGNIAIDRATGIGGVPRGRITEIYGPESSGKTTLSLHVIAEAQRAGGKAVFVDLEHALDGLYAQDLGVNLKELQIAQPATAEEASKILRTFLAFGGADVIVLDSIDAFVPLKAIEDPSADMIGALRARLLSQLLRSMPPLLRKSNTAVVFVNQIREKVGVMFGSPEVTPGGRAIKFYASMRIDLRVTGKLKANEEIFANEVKVKIVKNKLASPFKIAKVTLCYGKGIDALESLLSVAEEMDILRKSGAQWYYPEIIDPKVKDDEGRIAGSRAEAKKWLFENPDIAAKIREKVLQGDR